MTGKKKVRSDWATSADWKFRLYETIVRDPECGIGCPAIAIAYGRWANSSDAEVFMSRQDLVDETCLDPRTIKKAKADLERLGYLVLVGKTARGVDKYQLRNDREALVAEMFGDRKQASRAKVLDDANQKAATPKGVQKCTPNDNVLADVAGAEGGTKMHQPGGAKVHPPGGAEMHPDYVDEPVDNTVDGGGAFKGASRIGPTVGDYHYGSHDGVDLDTAAQGEDTPLRPEAHGDHGTEAEARLLVTATAEIRDEDDIDDFIQMHNHDLPITGSPENLSRLMSWISDIYGCSAMTSATKAHRDKKLTIAYILDLNVEDDHVAI